MRIGIDFDNTLADYTGVFHSVALSLGWIDDRVGMSKNAVKQYFFKQQRERVWTELQGIVYGREIHRARLYSGAAQTIRHWLQQGHEVFVVSHKTRFPVIGERQDLHACALQWLCTHELVGEREEQIDVERVFFQQTREQKIGMISELGLGVFIDDLPEVFSEPSFPSRTKQILFDPDAHHGSLGQVDRVVSSWDQVADAVAAL